MNKKLVNTYLYYARLHALTRSLNIKCQGDATAANNRIN